MPTTGLFSPTEDILVICVHSVNKGGFVLFPFKLFDDCEMNVGIPLAFVVCS